MADQIKSESRSQSTGFFMITELAERRVEAKRKRKGLGELKPRPNAWYKQLVEGFVLFGVANTVVAPLERCRIIL